MREGLLADGKFRTLSVTAVLIAMLWGIGLGASKRNESAATGILFSIEIPARLDRAGAEQLFAKLSALGYDAYIDAPATGAGSGYRVKVGKYSDLSQTSEVIGKLQKDGFNPVVSRFKESSGVLVATAAASAPANKVVKPAEKEPGAPALVGSAVQTASTPAEAPAINTSAPPATGSQKIIGGVPAANASSEMAAAPEAAADSVDQLSAGGVFTALRTGGALIFVLSAIIGVFFLLRRIAPERFGKPAKDKLIKAVDSMALGDRRSIMIVEVEGEKYLLGATPQSIALLGKLDSKSNAKAAPIAQKKDFNQIYNTKKSEMASDATAQQKNVRLSDVTSKLKELSRSVNL
jgi:flagellar protein FliO/FliZ